MSDVNYTKVNWQAYPNKQTKLTAANLNTMDQGIYDCATQINTINGQISSMNTAISGKVNTSDIQNNLTSTATNKPLSAAQGKAINDRFVFNTLIVSNGSTTVTIKSNKIYLVCSHGLGDKYTIGVLSTVYAIHFSIIDNDGSNYLNWTCSGNNATFVNLDGNTVGLSITEM